MLFNLHSAGEVAAGGAARQHRGEARSWTAGAKHFHSHILSWEMSKRGIMGRRFPN